MTRSARMGVASVDDAKPASSNYHAQALARGLALLELLADAPRPLTLTDFHERAGLPKSTLVRLLAVLSEMEYVVRVDEQPTFRLGHKVLTLSTAYVSSLDVSVSAGGYMAELTRRMGQTSNLGMLDGDKVLHVCVKEGDRPVRFTAVTGVRDDTYCTGLGKTLLAALDPAEVPHHLPPEPYRQRTKKTLTTLEALSRDLRKTRRRGYAFDDTEGSVGLRCLAVPVEVDGECLAALSLSGPAGEFSNDQQRAYLDALRETAAAMVADRDLVAALRITRRSLLPAEDAR